RRPDVEVGVVGQEGDQVSRALRRLASRFIAGDRVTNEGRWVAVLDHTSEGQGVALPRLCGIGPGHVIGGGDLMPDQKVVPRTHVPGREIGDVGDGPRPTLEAQLSECGRVIAEYGRRLDRK